MLVASAASERAVRKVMLVASVTMTMVVGSPTLPSNHPIRRCITTPSIVRRLGMNTPLNVPQPYPGSFNGVTVVEAPAALSARYGVAPSAS